MSAIGIDFGSSYSTISWINPHSGKPEAVKFNGDGSVKLPSVIFASEDGFHYGFQASSYFDEISLLPIQQRMEYLPNFIPSLKRIMEPNGYEYFFNKRYSHSQLLESLLSYMISQARLHCGSDYYIDNVTISHPVDFPKNKIQILKNSLTCLGFQMIDTVPEPISAIYGYSIDHQIQEGEGILVFDFGGGTIDVAYVQKRNGELTIATEPRGNSNCGGQDIDFSLYNNLCKTLQHEMNIDISREGVVDQVVLSACRRLKEKFSGDLDAYETMVLLQVNDHICNYKYRLNRDSFNSIIMQVVSSAIHVADLVISDVKSKGLPINKALLIGGSSQITIIRDLLSEKLYADSTIETCGEKDIVVALGNLVRAMKLECKEEAIGGTIQNASDTPPFPSKEPLDLNKSIICKNPSCGSERCYHFGNRRGYHCIDCGWEGANVIVSYKN